MVIPEERDGKLKDDLFNMQRDATSAQDTVSTRKGGQQKQPEEQKVSFS